MKITKFEYHQKKGVGIVGRWENKPIWYAETETDNGATYFVSRFPDETEWYVDAIIGKNGFPHFVHGEGSRCCMKKTIIGETKIQLDKMKEEWGNKIPVEVYGD